jgi:TRAP-type C4-dicarboxylate transport system permease small subunit
VFRFFCFFDLCFVFFGCLLASAGYRLCARVFVCIRKYDEVTTDYHSFPVLIQPVALPPLFPGAFVSFVLRHQQCSRNKSKNKKKDGKMSA